MANKILVTGVNGFVGKHLVRELRNRECEVIGVGHDSQLDSTLHKLVNTYIPCDLTDPLQVAKLPIADIDGVISLAGLANVGASFDNPKLYQKVNVQVFSLLAKRLLAIDSSARIVVVSTGAVYAPDQSMPLTEDSKLITDGSPYAFSKIAMEKEASQLTEKGLDCVIVRPFNHIGPGQAPGFILPDLYKKIQEAIKSGKPIKISPLTTKRDYTDVRDVVKAYTDLVLASRLDHNIYNVCSNHSTEGRIILDMLLKEVDPEGKLIIEQDPNFKPRPNDPADLYGSNERLRTQTGWKPVINIEQTIHDFVTAI